LIRREQYEQELQAEDEQYIQADGLSGQQVCTHYLSIQEGYTANEGASVLYFFLILLGIKRRMIDISNKKQRVLFFA
jgi:hypothetical protein